jgi:hypothetical protein
MKLSRQPLRVLFLITVLLQHCSASRAQTIIQSFAGVNLNDTIGLGTGAAPPDTMGAVGTNYFVEFINGAFAIYSRAGVRQTLKTDSDFWVNAGISASTVAAGLTDPRVIYDSSSGRWFASELTIDAVSNQVLVARSNTSDPTGGWQAVHFVANTSNGDSGDFDTLGVDATGVYIAVNDFDALGNMTGVSLFSIPKADLMASTPTLANMTRFENLSDVSYGYALQGVTNPDSGLGHGVIIAIDDYYNYFDRTTIFGSGSAGATLGAPVRIHNVYDALPNPALQPTSAYTIDTGDDRFSASVRQVGSYIYMANNIMQGSRDAVHWMVLREADNVLIGEGIINDATHDFYYPSIAANHAGKILLVFNRSGSSSPDGNISIYAAVGTVTNGGVTMGTPFLVRQGSVSSYHLSFDLAPYRWGDYSATMADPTDDNLFWTIQEIPTLATLWGTQITLISVAMNTPSLALTPAGANLTLSWPLSSNPAYVLQYASSLAPGTVWNPVPYPVTVVVNQNVVTVPSGAGPMYYRLKQ